MYQKSIAVLLVALFGITIATSEPESETQAPLSDEDIVVQSASCQPYPECRQTGEKQ